MLNSEIAAPMFWKGMRQSWGAAKNVVRVAVVVVVWWW